MLILFSVCSLIELSFAGENSTELTFSKSFERVVLLNNSLIKLKNVLNGFHTK